MKRRVLSIGAAMLLMAGFVGGYLVNSAVGQRSAAADSAAAVPQVQSYSSTGSSIDSSIEQAYNIAKKSVVFVNNPGNGTGSGVIYDTQGDIVTNAHVTSGGKAFKVTFSNGKTVTATLVGSDSADDLAIIHVNTTGLTPATFASAGSYRVAETVLAIGSPLGLEQSVTSGLISGLNRTEQEPSGAYIPDAIQTSAAINPGNSGGALVSLNGDVVGIPTIVQTTTTGNETVQNIGFAIPSSRVTYVANQLIQYGKVVHTGRAFLGVSVGDSSAQQTPFGFFGNGQGAATVTGAVVEQIKSTGPAGRAGLQQGDVVTKFDGASITSSNDLLAALSRTKPGQTVSLTYNRNGANHTVQVTLGQLPA
jgi:putative serine protease PepD